MEQKESEHKNIYIRHIKSLTLCVRRHQSRYLSTRHRSTDLTNNLGEIKVGIDKSLYPSDTMGQSAATTMMGQHGLTTTLGMDTDLGTTAQYVLFFGNVAFLLLLPFLFAQCKL